MTKNDRKKLSLFVLTPRVIAASGATCGSIIALNTVSIRFAPGGAGFLALLVDAIDGAVGALGTVRVLGAGLGAGCGGFPADLLGCVTSARNHNKQ